MANLKIRNANYDEALEIATVLAASFRGYQSLYTEKAYAATIPEEAEIKNRFSEGAIWVALLEEKIIGTVSVIPQRESLYIRSMAILPEARGNRIGERLLSEVEQYAIDSRCKYLTLSTTPFLDPAIRLYEKFAFVRTGTDDLFGTPLIRMEKKL